MLRIQISEMARQQFSVAQVIEELDDLSQEDFDDVLMSDTDEEADFEPSTAVSNVETGVSDESEIRSVLRIRNPVYKRRVHDIASALDMENYHEIQEVRPHRSYVGILESGKNRNPNTEIIWSTKWPSSSGRQPRSAVIVGRRPGLNDTATCSDDCRKA